MLFDAIYDPWPTPLAAAAAAAGCRVASGLDLLLAQALGQFEQFTGVVPAPEDAMRAALHRPPRPHGVCACTARRRPAHRTPSHGGGRTMAAPVGGGRARRARL